MTHSPLFQNDFALLTQHPSLLGIDEAGRGALAGPVVIAGVVLDYDVDIPELNDSKLLSPAKRDKLFSIITDTALEYSIIEIPADVIDEINIRQASLLGFEKAYNSIGRASFCLIDGKDVPVSMQLVAKCVVKGDRTHACIAAASVLAKVHRDRLMTGLANIYPHYGFEHHKGYGTQLHCHMVMHHGRCDIHRASFHIPPPRIE